MFNLLSETNFTPGYIILFAQAISTPLIYSEQAKRHHSSCPLLMYVSDCQCQYYVSVVSAVIS